MAKFGLISLCLLFFCCPLCAQQKQEIPREELARIYDNSIDKMERQSRRMTSLSETRTDNEQMTVYPPGKSSPVAAEVQKDPPKSPISGVESRPLHILTASKTILEISAAGDYQLFFDNSGRTFQNKGEIIQLNGKVYLLDQNKRPVVPLVQSLLSLPLPALPEKGKFSFLGSEIFNGQTVNVYQSVENKSAINKLATTVIKFRFSEDGELRQTEIIRLSSDYGGSAISKDIPADRPIDNLLPAEAAERSKEARRQETSRAELPPVPASGLSTFVTSIITTYEIDPGIKIEAPGK